MSERGSLRSPLTPAPRRQTPLPSPGDGPVTSPGSIARSVRPRPLHDNIPLDRGAAVPSSPGLQRRSDDVSLTVQSGEGGRRRREGNSGLHTKRRCLPVGRVTRLCHRYRRHALARHKFSAPTPSPPLFPFGCSGKRRELTIDNLRSSGVCLITLTPRDECGIRYLPD